MTAQTSLRWGVKASFREYVTRAGGTVSYGAPTTWADVEFDFPFAEVHRYSALGTVQLSYAGEVLFQAYGGLLQVRIADPRIEFGPDAVFLSAATAIDANDAQRSVIGTIRFGAEGWAGHHGERVTLPLRLTDIGSILLGGVYPPETEVDPMTFTVPTREVEVR